MSDHEGLSEDDAVFTDSEGERLEYSDAESSASNSRAGSNAGDSEESEAVATDEEEDEQAKSKKRKKRQQKADKKRRLKSKVKRSRFVDTEAAVGDDDDEEDDYGAGYSEGGEEEEEDDNGEDGFVDNEIEDREKEFSAAFERRLAAHAAKRAAARKEFEEKWDPEAEEERLRQLYGRTRHLRDGDIDSGAAASTLAQVMQPTANDPKLWLVKCRPGKERTAVAALMRGLDILGDPLGVFSVLGRDSLKGFIYVEAHKVNDVMNAVQKTKTNHLIFASPINKPVMVPLTEMVDVLSAGMNSAASTGKGQVDAALLNVGGWVRIKRGKYLGDLAQVIEVDEENTGEGTDYIVRVKLLPRLSYRTSGTGKKERPSARPFDPQEAAQYGSVTKARGYWIFNGEAYKDGFLYKDVRASSLSLGNVEPRSEELERFGVLSISDDVEDGSRPGTSTKLSKGEAVVITRGEFLNMTGIVEATPEGDLISVKLDDSIFTEPVQIQGRFVDRRLEVGDMVQVLAGESEGKSGMIVSLAKEAGKTKAIIFNPSENNQFTVPLAFLKSSTVTDLAVPPGRRLNRGEGVNSLELFDLVTIENEDGEAGVVLRLHTDEQQVSILDNNGQARKLSVKSVRKVPKAANPPGARFDPNVLKAGDRVQVGEDPSSPEGRPATVLHVFRTHAFVRMIDTGEVLCRPLQSISRPGSYSGIYRDQSSPQSSSARSFAPMRHLIGRSVTIAGAGPYKGYVGIVKDLTDTHARVELHTDSKVVNVGRERIVLPGSEGSNSGPAGSRTPAWGLATGKTPAWTDSRTPAWGGQSSKTPAWGAQSSKTPAWGAQSSKTPAWGAQSGKTPAWDGVSSRTPAWGASGGKTPAWGASGGKTPAWGASSSKTPAWGPSSSKTLAWGGTTSSRTPAAHDGGKTPTWQSARGESATTIPPWAIPDAEVVFKSGGGVGRVVSVEPNGLLRLAGQSDSVSFKEVNPSAPNKKDAVRLLNEDQASGTVIGLDGPDAVIRVDGTADFRIVPISNLVKITRP